MRLGGENKITGNQKGTVGKIADTGHGAAQAVDRDSKENAHSPIRSPQEIYEEGRGFPYQSVRSCDLDRFSDK